MESKQYGNFTSVLGENLPKEDVYILAEYAFKNAIEFLRAEKVDLLKCKFEIIPKEHAIPDYLTGEWEPRTSVAWKITVKE
jgi:hypothetical protein